MRDNDATFSEEQFNIPQAETEHVIQPNSMADDLGGKAMAVARVGRRLRADNLAGRKPDCQTRLT